MAHIEDKTDLPPAENRSQEVSVEKGEAQGGEVVATAEVTATKDAVASSLDSKGMATEDDEKNPKTQPSTSDSSSTISATPSASVPARPTLVQLGSSTSATAHPKKFSASNINKKFLEKTSSTSGAATTTSNSTIHKPNGGPIARPVMTTTTSHPRLVTTKLTGAPQSLSPGPGWSRPSSATPTIASSASPTPGTMPSLPPNSTGPGNTSSSSSSSAPQLSHAGKVVQPQPRSALLQTTNLSSKQTSKSVWGGSKVNAIAPNSTSESNVQADFPTAAEVAQGATSRKAKNAEAKGFEDDTSISGSKPARNEEADTFRGVHLDPNAHHWDEMEEDGDDFLNNVIEFNDGRQYKIESVHAPSPPHSPSLLIDGAQHSRRSSTEVHVSKEDRFADDFDRSWPRSKPSPAVSARGLPSTHASREHPVPPSSASPILSHPPQSPSEGSRVLFNERLNKLEPYSGSNNFRAGHEHPPSSKRSDYSTSPSEFRRGRDLPPHQPSANVQLLQKQSGGDFHSGPRSRDNYRDRDQRRDAPQANKAPLRSPRISEGFGDSLGPSRDREPGGEQFRGRRQSNMGPPPVPAHARDSRRQAPPHLPQTSPAVSTHSLPSRDSAHPPTSAKVPPSPALSHATPSLAPSGLPPVIAGPEIDNIRKDLMHDAAERAKQRRQAEEAEREKERDRARQKAAQLEERLKAAEAAKAKAQEKAQEASVQGSEVIATIEDAVKGISVSSHTEVETSAPLHNAPLKRPPSLTPSTRPGITRRKSQVPPSPTTETPATRAESWRSKVTPSVEPTATKPPVPQFSAVSALHHIESSLSENAEMEVVDFSDLGQFVDPQKPSEPAEAKEEEKSEQRPKRTRPVALDFFDAQQSVVPAITSPGAPSEVGPWRRKTTLPSSEPVKPTEHEVTAASEAVVLTSPRTSTFDASLTHASTPTAPNHSIPPQGQPRTPRTPHFSKDMSAIDDAMLRIKGAIDGMHGSQLHKELASVQGSNNAAKTILPLHIEVEPLVTRSEPPPSPTKAWSVHRVRLPKMSVPREPISKGVLFQIRRGSRWPDVSSLPPPSGRGRPDFSITELLFGKPKGKPRVFVPRLNGTRPIAKVNLSGSFGKPSGADSAMSWRKPAISSPLATITQELETTSRSPPPDAVNASAVGPTDAKVDTETALAADLVQRRSSLRKMPIGSAVAAYRDSRVDVLDTDSAPVVNFTVGSELEDLSSLTNEVSPELKKPVPVSDRKPDESRVVMNGDHHERPPSVPMTPSKAGSKASDSSSEHGPRTPSTHASSLWSNSSISFPVKESPVRDGVDHPHLKELWTQISEKPSHPSVNSLERIEDELPTLPSTLQEVKSEGGETPPPFVPNPKMSSFDVIRGFQQVPTSTSAPVVSNTNSHRPTLPTSTTSAPVARPAAYAYPMAASPSPGWPMYNYSPMMAPSPAPVMYGPAMTPSPVPARMTVNGQATYAWVPATPAPGQPPNHMMGRMPPSPYPMHMTAYPPPGTPTLYGASPVMGMQPPQPQPVNHAQNRGRNASLASPVVAPGTAHPYYANPAMMMQPSTPHAQNHPYSHDPARMRHDNGHQPMQHHPISNHPNYGPTPTPSTTFSRPW